MRDKGKRLHFTVGQTDIAERALLILDPDMDPERSMTNTSSHFSSASSILGARVIMVATDPSSAALGKMRTRKQNKQKTKFLE
jgi:hypothetical protein